MYDSYICVTDSIICMTWLIRTCHMTHAHVRHKSIICVPWRIHMCHMAHIYLCRDSFIRVTFKYARWTFAHTRYSHQQAHTQAHTRAHTHRNVHTHKWIRTHKRIGTFGLARWSTLRNLPPQRILTVHAVFNTKNAHAHLSSSLLMSFVHSCGVSSCGHRPILDWRRQD